MSSKLYKQKQIFSLLNSRAFPLEEQIGDKSGDLSSGSHSSERERNPLLHQVYHFHKNVIQNLNAGLLTLDLNGAITFANRGSADLTGYAVKQLLDMKIQKLFSNSEDADKLLTLCAVPGKKIDEWETQFIRKDGHRIEVEISASHLIDTTNNFEGIVVLFRDVTEIHQLQKQVERMERLALLGELSAGIAHEIRNPLAGIKAATQVLEEVSDFDEPQKQLVHRIVREVDKANRLLKEFFKFAKPGKPKLSFHSIETIVESVYLLLAPRFRKSNIEFVEDFPEKMPPIYVDETQIEQVLLNLFLNALDAMDEGGRLTVTTFKESLTDVEQVEHQYVGVKITDTGHGIAEEVKEKIFNPFFTTKQDGLGLGLSICSRLIEENRGRIEVFSTPGEGTCFVVLLPTFQND
ncbi:MAG: PAS domain S-box protein [Calditrichaeota bacterium]|nr:MAG: PAS domain S-box protein [Calditrichota bacterium]